MLNAWVGDPETDVVSVTCTINGQTYTLRKSPITPYAIADTGGYALWEYDIPDITTGGTYSFTFKAKNKAGLTAEYSGTFTIYTALQGNWYINNQPITSPTQTIYATSPTVSFKFQKTAGVEKTHRHRKPHMDRHLHIHPRNPHPQTCSQRRNKHRNIQHNRLNHTRRRRLGINNTANPNTHRRNRHSRWSNTPHKRKIALSYVC